MGLFSNAFFDQWLFPSVLIFLLLGSVFAFVVGLGLILRGAVTLQSFGAMNRWVSMRKAMRPVEIPRNTEAVLHRQSRGLGIIFVVGAALSLIALARGFDVAAIVYAFRNGSDSAVIETVARTVKWLLLLGDAIAIVVGIAMISAPQALARLETRANRWYSVRRHDQNFDKMHMGVERWAESYPRTLGWIIVIFSVFVFVNLGAVYLAHY